VRDRREAGSDVRLDHPPAALPALVDEHLQGVVRRQPGAEPEAARQEDLEDRLEHDLGSGLHAHHRRLCCPAAQPVLRPPPTPTRPAIHFPGSPFIGHRSPVTRSAGCRAGEGLPVPAVTIGTFRAPYAGESFAAALPGSSPLPWPSPWIRGLGSPCSRPKARPLTTPQAPLNATDRTVAPPVTGPLTLGSDPARFQTKPPACYRASWQLPGPDSHRQATTSLRTRRSTVAYVTVSPPIPLGARKIEAKRICLKDVLFGFHGS
jgi:hypothetical protein